MKTIDFSFFTNNLQIISQLRAFYVIVENKRPSDRFSQNHCNVKK